MSTKSDATSTAQVGLDIYEQSAESRLLLIVRCIGLGVSSKATFKNVGLWNSLYLRATGKSNHKHEKRVVKISQSEPFKPTGRPPNFNFALVYVSEVFEDVCDVTPSMVAAVRCPAHLDCKLRINVYYSSALTGGKEVLLAGTTFTKRELIRATAADESSSSSNSSGNSGNSGSGSSPNNSSSSESSSSSSSSSGCTSRSRDYVLISEMNSEHCASAKAYVEVMSPLPPVLQSTNNRFTVIAAPYRSKTSTTATVSASDAAEVTGGGEGALSNPLEQHYTFYNEVDSLSPLMDCHEVAWEPRFAGLVSLLFLESFTASLVRSINAWNMRAEMERKRQGRFRSLEEAFSCGWHSLTVTVRAARIGDWRPQNMRVEQQQLKDSQAHANNSSGSSSGNPGVGAAASSASGGGSSGAAATNSGPLYTIMVPLNTVAEQPTATATSDVLLCTAAADNNSNSEHATEGSADVSASRQQRSSADTTTAAAVSAPSSSNDFTERTRGNSAATAAAAAVASVSGSKSRGSVARNGAEARRRIDDSCPSTFVEIALESRRMIFQQPVGRTNTEYHTMDPQYGSNLNATFARKGSTEAVGAHETVEVVTSVREVPFVAYETADRDAFARAKLHRRRFLHNLKLLDASRRQHSSSISNSSRGDSGADASSRSNSGSGNNTNSGRSGSNDSNSSSNNNNNSRSGRGQRSHTDGALGSGALISEEFAEQLLQEDVAGSSTDAGDKKIRDTTRQPRSKSLLLSASAAAAVDSSSSSSYFTGGNNSKSNNSSATESSSSAAAATPVLTDERVNPHSYDGAVALASNAIVNYVAVLTKETHFYKYLPPDAFPSEADCNSSSSSDCIAVRFDLCLEESSSSRKRLGTCTLVLSAGMKTECWLPLQLTETRCGAELQHPSTSNAAAVESMGGSSSALCEDMELLVSVSVKSASTTAAVAGTAIGVDEAAADDARSQQRSADSAPAQMAETFLYRRTSQGAAANKQQLAAAHPPTSTAAAAATNDAANASSTAAAAGDVRAPYYVDRALSALTDYREAIADSYEWMWQLGFNGHDPLALTRHFPGAAEPAAAEAALRNGVYRYYDPFTSPAATTTTTTTAVATAAEEAADVKPDPALFAATVDALPTTNATSAATAAAGSDRVENQSHKLTLQQSDFVATTNDSSAVADSDDEFDSTAGDLPLSLLPTTATAAKLATGLATTTATTASEADMKSTAVFSDGRENVEVNNVEGGEWEAYFTHERRNSIFDCCADARNSLPRSSAEALDSSRSSRGSKEKDCAEAALCIETADSDDELLDDCPAQENIGSAAAAISTDTTHADVATTTGAASNGVTTPQLSPIAKRDGVAAHRRTGSLSQQQSAAGRRLEKERQLQQQQLQLLQRQPVVYPRVDFQYPIEWMRAYVSEMEQLTLELRSLLPELRSKHSAQRTFRPSTAKKDASMQPLPLNLHYQLLNVRQHTTQRDPVTEVVHCLTAGAMTAHALGHKKGGLFYQEGKLVARRNELEWLKQCFGRHVMAGGGTRIPVCEPFAAQSALQQLGEQTLRYEEICLQIAHRRVYAISQALSIAVNALLLKLSLVVEERVDSSICEGWLHSGFLVVFEGLLSVVNHERSMLEDTISAVDALRNYQVQVTTNATATVASTAAATSVDSASAEGVNSSSNDGDGGIQLEMRGREVLIRLSQFAVLKLPSRFRKSIEDKSAIIQFVPVLFTQGIDIQQTLMTTFGGESKGNVSSVDLQQRVNLKAFRDLNEFCLRAQPISHSTASPTAAAAATVDQSNSGSSSDEAAGGAADLTGLSLNSPLGGTINYSNNSSGGKSGIDQQQQQQTSADASAAGAQIHPLVHVLHSVILSASPTLKNVDLLMEVERLALLLGGCRVVFCKSGKDRTGMAVTLAQSRQLGEQYGCGVTQQRVLRDANLMRVTGARIMICEKNIGKRVYSFNMLQAQFLPAVFRPPAIVCEELMRKDNS